MSNHKVDPASKGMAVTPNDSTDFTDSGAVVLCRGVSLEVGGNLAWLDENGASRLAKGLAAGVIHPISTKRILASGTTATGICVYW